MADTAYIAEPLNGIDEDFLPLLLDYSKLPELRSQTGVPGLNRDRAYALDVDLPPLNEQRRIVDLVTALDDTIRAEAKFSLAATGVYQETLTKICTEKLRRRSLSEFLVQDRSATKVENALSYRLAGLARSGEGFIDRGIVNGAEIKYNSLIQIKADQLVYRKLTAWEGPISVSGHEIAGAWVSSEFPVFDIDQDQMLPGLLRHVSRWEGFWQEMAALLTGSVLRRKRLNPQQLLAIRIPVASLEVQMEQRDLLDSIWESRSVATIKLEALHALRSNLLGSLLSGAHEIPKPYDEVLSVS